MLYAETVVMPPVSVILAVAWRCSMHARLVSRFMARVHSQAPRDEAMSAMLDVSKSSVDVWRIGATHTVLGSAAPRVTVDRSKGRIKGSDDPFVLPLILD